MGIVPIILIISFAAMVVLGAYVIAHGYHKPINVTFAGFSFFVAAWDAMIYTQIVYGAILIVGKLAFSFAIVGLAFFLAFCYLYPERKHLSLRTWIFIFAPASVFFIIPLTGDLFLIDMAVENGQILIVQAGPLYNLYTPVAPMYIIASLIVLVIKYIKIHGPYRLHLKYLILGCVLSLVPAVFTNLLLPNLLGIYDYNSLGPTFALFMIAAVSYAILRYRLFDIRVILGEGALFVISGGGLIVLYLFISVVTRSQSIAALITFFTLPLIKKYIYDPLRGLIFSYGLQYARILQDISDYVRDSASLSSDEFLDEILGRLKKGLRADAIGAVLFSDAGTVFTSLYHGMMNVKNAPIEGSSVRAFVKKNTDSIIDTSELEESLKNGFSPREIQQRTRLLEDMRAMKAEIVFPIAYGSRVFGIFVFGQKDTRDGYTIQDIEIMSHAGKLSAFVFELKRSAVMQIAPVKNPRLLAKATL